MNRKSMRKSKIILEGSFTVEAAVIFPIIFILIFQLLLLAFSLHDTVITKCADYRLLISKEMKSQENYPYNNNFCANYNSYLNSVLILKEKNTYSIPVSFTNTNNTELLRKYLALKIK